METSGSIARQRKYTRSVLITSLAIVAIGTAISSASAVEATIYPGVGIGKVKLGMSLTQVRGALGRDYLLGRHSTSGGVRYVEYQWDFANWTVTFAQRDRALRAVQVVTSVKSQRTTKGVGRSTSWRKVVQAYPGGQCGWSNPNYSAFGLYLAYLVPHKGGTQTLFLFNGDYSKALAKVVGYHVLATFVRTQYEAIDGFGVNRQYRCSDDWQNTDVPVNVPIR